MKDAAFLLNAISESAATDSRGLELIIDKIIQEFPGSHSQPVNASDAEAIIDTIVSANLASLKQISVPRSRKGYAVHECRKCLGSDGKLNPRRLIVLALLLCPGEPHVKYEKLLMLVPPAEEVDPLPIPEAVAVLSTIRPDFCAAAKGVICVNAVFSGYSALLPTLFHAERERSMTALFGGLLANAVSTIGNKKLSVETISMIVAVARDSMLELVTATAAHQEARQGGTPAQRPQGTIAERQLSQHSSNGRNVVRMPSFAASFGSVDLQREDSQDTSNGCDSTLLQVMQKYTRDTAALKYLLEQADTSAKGSRGSTDDFLDSSSRIYSASNSQNSGIAVAHAPLQSATVQDRDQPRGMQHAADDSSSVPHHYTPRDALSPSYPPEEPGSANSVNAGNMVRLETHSADTDPSRTGATDIVAAVHIDNVNTAKIRVQPAAAVPNGDRRGQIDAFRGSALGIRPPDAGITEPGASGPAVDNVSRAARPLVAEGAAALGLQSASTPVTAGHFGGHFRGRSLGGGEPSGRSETAFAVDGPPGPPGDSSRHHSGVQYTAVQHSSTVQGTPLRSSDSVPAAPSGAAGLMSAPSGAGSAALSQAPSTRRDVFQMSAVPRVQQGSPKVHVPYSTSPSDHVHLGDHNRMALAISGTLTASSHPLSNPASSPRSAMHHDGFSSAALTPDAMAAVQLAATSSDASALHRTLQKQTSHGHPWGAAPLHTAAGPIAGDMFAGAARWEQASAPGSDTGAVGGTPASHQPPLAGADGLHGTMPFGTFRRDASGDELNGVSLRADGQAIHVTSSPDGDQVLPLGTQSTRLSHRVRRMASRVPFVRSQIRQKDVPDVTFYSHSVLPSSGDGQAHPAPSPRRGRTVRLGGSGLDSAQSSLRMDGGGGGGTAPLLSRSRTMTKSASFAGGKLPVVTSKAMAMATVNRQLMVTAPQEGLGAGCKSLSSMGQTMPTPAGSVLLERLLQDTQDQAHGRGHHGSLMSPRVQTPAGSVAASDMSAPAAFTYDAGAPRSQHSSPPGAHPWRSRAAHSPWPSFDGSASVAAREAALSQPLPHPPTTHNSLDNIFSPQPGSSPAAGSAPLDRVEQIYHHRRRSSGRILPDGAVSVSVNGGIAARTKSPDAAPDQDRAETPEDTFDEASMAARRSPTLGPHRLSGHFVASMEDIATAMRRSRTASSSSSPMSSSHPPRNSASAPPTALHSQKRATERLRSSDGTSSPPAVPSTPAAGHGSTGDGHAAADRVRSSPSTRPSIHASNFSFGRSMQDPAVLAAADAVLWFPEDTLSSVGAGRTVRSTSSGDIHDSSKGMSVTLARRMDRHLSRSMPARRTLRHTSEPPPRRTGAATGLPATAPGPAQPGDDLSVQWERMAATSRSPSGSQLGDMGGHRSPLRSRTGSPESAQLTDTFLLPQPPASAALAPLSVASSSFFQDTSGVSFRTAASASSSFFQTQSPSADGAAAAAAAPWSHAVSSAAPAAHVWQSTESHGSSVASVAVHGAGPHGRAGQPPPISTESFFVPPGPVMSPQEVSPAPLRRSFSAALRDEFAAAHSHVHGGTYPLAPASPARSVVTAMLDEETDVRVQQLLQDMQLQVDLAANATDNELRVQADRHAAAKAEVDPIKAVTSMAAVLGGKFFLLQGVRLILSVCLLVSSVAGFFALLQYAKINVALSLTIVVGVNVCLAGVLLLIIILKAPSQSGLGDLLRPSGNGGGVSSLQAVLPTFHPVIKDAFHSIVKQSQEASGGAGGQGGGDGGGTGGGGDGGGAGTRTTRGTRGQAPATNAARVPRRASVTPRGMPLPTIDPSAVQRAASPPDAAPTGAARQQLARGSAAGPGERPGGVLTRVVDTGTAIMNRLPPKHRESQVGRIARGLLMELRDHSQQSAGGQTPDSGAVAEGGRMRDESGSSRHARSFAGPAPEIREMPTYEWS